MEFKVTIKVSAVITAALLFIIPMSEHGAEPAQNTVIHESPANTVSIGSEEVLSLVRDLKSKDYTVRSCAIDALRKIGASAVPPIIEALTDTDSNVRKGVVDALGIIGIVNPEVLSALIKTVGDCDGNVRKSAVQSLEKLGAITVELKVKRHILDLDDSNEDVRNGAMQSLNRIGPVTPEVIPSIMKALGDSDYSVRRKAEEFFEKRNSMTAKLKAKKYILDLKCPNKSVRMRAVETLGNLGAVTPELVPALITALSDKYIRARAIESLGNIGAEAKAALPFLTNALGDSDRSVRMEAAEALGKMGPIARSATPALKKALKDSDPAVREKAIDALGKIGALTIFNKISYFASTHPFIMVSVGICVFIALIFAAWFVVPFAWRIIHPMGWLMHELHSTDSKRRVVAAEKLGKIGRPAVLPLIKTLRHSNGDVRISAAGALNNIASLPPKAIPFLLQSLRDKEIEVRRSITEVFGKTGSVTADVISALMDAIGDRDAHVRASAAEALGKLGVTLILKNSNTRHTWRLHKNGPIAQEVISVLIKALGDSSYHVRDSAANALEKCGAMTIDLKVKRCITDLGDSHGNIRSRATEELSKTDEAAVPELIKALGDGSSHIRRFAFESLEKHNALTTELKVKRYVLDLEDSNPRVCMKAADALGDIGPEASEAIPRLIKLIGNSDHYIHLHAVTALEKLKALSSESEVKRYILNLESGESDNF